MRTGSLSFRSRCSSLSDNTSPRAEDDSKGASPRAKPEADLATVLVVQRVIAQPAKRPRAARSTSSSAGAADLWRCRRCRVGSGKSEATFQIGGPFRSRSEPEQIDRRGHVGSDAYSTQAWMSRLLARVVEARWSAGWV